MTTCHAQRLVTQKSIPESFKLVIGASNEQFELVKFPTDQMRQDFLGLLAVDVLGTFAVETISHKLLPIEEFVMTTNSEFRRSPQANYAYAWALTHFLRHGPKQYDEIHETLFELLEHGGLSTQAAIEKAFAGVDFDAMQKDFWKYVRTLK